LGTRTQGFLAGGVKVHPIPQRQKINCVKRKKTNFCARGELVNKQHIGGKRNKLARRKSKKKFGEKRGW